MQGVVLIDAREQHIARIDGTLFKEVGFGWGILGHLDQGGHFQVDQADISDDSWAISRMDLAFTGKILLFKNINIKSTETYSDFRPVPADLTFAQGIQLLEEAAGGNRAKSAAQRQSNNAVPGWVGHSLRLLLTFGVESSQPGPTQVPQSKFKANQRKKTKARQTQRRRTEPALSAVEGSVRPTHWFPPHTD